MAIIVVGYEKTKLMTSQKEKGECVDFLCAHLIFRIDALTSS